VAVSGLRGVSNLDWKLNKGACSLRYPIDRVSHPVPNNLRDDSFFGQIDFLIYCFTDACLVIVSHIIDRGEKSLSSRIVPVGSC
jgi:hypothetical protein